MAFQHTIPAYNRATQSLATVIVILAATGCDTSALTATDKAPLGAKFQDKGSACVVMIRFAGSVKGSPASTASHYRLQSGEGAIAARDAAELHAVLVTFPRAVTQAEVIRVDPGTPAEVLLEMSRSESDVFPAIFLGARFDPDADEAIVRLTFDDALDPTVATDVTRYTLPNTSDHPMTATVTDCGREVLLSFDALGATTVIAMDGLIDVNGLPIEDHPAVTVEPAEEGERPEVVSALFPVNGSSAGVEVTFSTTIDRATAEEIGRYTLMPDDQFPTGAKVLPGGRTVFVAFDGLDPPVSISIDGVMDLARNPMVAVTAIDVLEPEDETPPSVTSVTAAGRGEGPTIRVTFSEAVARESAERLSSYILVEPGEEGPQNGDADSGLRPMQAVLQSGGAAVNLTFDYIAVGAMLDVQRVADLSGNVIAQEEPIALDAANDKTAPAVLAVTAVPNALTTSLDVIFDKTVDPVSAETNANYVLSTGNTDFTVTLQPDGRTVRLVTTVLALTSTVSISGVADTLGHVMQPAMSMPIDPSGNFDPPAVSSVVFSSDSATPTVLVTFSEAVDRSSAEIAGNYLSVVDNHSPTAAVLQSDGRTVVLTFGPMSSEQQINVNAVMDLSGNAIENAAVIIDAGEDVTPPTVEAARFLANKLSPTLELTFSEAVNKTLATATGLYLMGVDVREAQTATMPSDARTVQLVFGPVGLSDKLSIRSITDMNGNAMNAVADLSVTPAQESNKPSVVSVSFAPNGTQPIITVVFSEAIDRTTAEMSASYQTGSSGLSPNSAVMRVDSRTIDLVYGALSKTDTLVVRNVTDFAGNLVDTSTQHPIASNEETTRPTITSATVATSTLILLVFSEAVDETSAETRTNYSGAGSNNTVLTATLQSDGRTVALTSAGTAVVSGAKMTLSGVLDLNGNAILSATSVTLTGSN